MAQRRKKSKVVAYLRVSTVDQDLEKNRVDILTFANEKDFGKVEFVALVIVSAIGLYWVFQEWIFLCHFLWPPFRGSPWQIYPIQQILKEIPRFRTK